MSLKGAKLIWLNKKDKHEKIIKLKNKKNFKFGYYMTNDFILENPKSKSVQCEIVADAFNRISIVNCSKQNPVLLNGFPVKTRRPLLHGNKIKIFDEEFVWQFPKNGRTKSIETEKNEYKIETPIKNQYENIPAPSSEPWKKKNREKIRARLSAHSLVQNQGNETSEESDQEGNNKATTSVQITKRNTMINRRSNINELSEQLKLRRTFDYLTPVKQCDNNSSLIKFDFTLAQNKENMRKNSIQLCKSSGTLLTSYSPQIENDIVKSNSSFAYVKSAKNTPKSVYGTPKSVLSELGNDQDIEMSLDLINFSTPSAKHMENNGSMFLIDLTTPAQPEYGKDKNDDSTLNKTPINIPVTKLQKLKSALKNSKVSDVTKSVKKVKMALGNKERSPLQLEDRNPKRLRLSTSHSPTLKTSRRSLSLSCTKIVKNNSNEINSTTNKNISSLENSKNFPKEIDLSDTEKINISNKIVQGSFSSFETIDNTINLDDASTVQEENETSVIEVSDDSVFSNVSLKSLSNSTNNKNISQKLNGTPHMQKNLKTPQSLMKKVLLSSARNLAHNSNSPAILNAASTPIHVKQLSLSFSNRNYPERKSVKIERNSTRFNLNSSILSTTPLTNRKSMNSSLIKSAPLNSNIKNSEKFNKAATDQRKSILISRDSTKSGIHQNRTPKRHSCGNTRLARALLTPTDITSNKKIRRTSTAILNSSTKLNRSLQSKNINTPNSTVINRQTNLEILTILPKLNQNKSVSFTNNIDINVEKIKCDESSGIDVENSALNDTFTVDSDSEENLETQQSVENLSMTNSENKVFISLTKNKSSEIEKDMSRVKKLLEPNKENIEYETNIQQTSKLTKTTKSKNDENKILPIENFKKRISNIMSTPNMDGVKHLISTPKNESTPIHKTGKETLKSSKLKSSSSPKLKNRRSLLKTPNSQEHEVNLSGIQELSTPNEIENKSEKTNNSSRYLKSIAEEETEGLDSIYKTPSARTIMVSEKACQSTSTKKYLISTSEIILNPSSFQPGQEIEIDNPDPLFDTSLQNFKGDCGSTPRTTLDTAFDKLIGKRSTVKSYSNKKYPKKEFTYTIDTDLSSEIPAKTDVQEWVENITLTNLQDSDKFESREKMQNISSDFVTIEDISDNAINVSGIDILDMSHKTVDSLDESLNDITSNTGTSSLNKSKEIIKSAKKKNHIRNEFKQIENIPNKNLKKSFTPDVQKVKSKGNSDTLDVPSNFIEATEEKEKQIADENFEKQPNLIVQKSFTPELQKTKSRIPRKTLDNIQILNSSFDLEEVRNQKEKELAFEHFEEQPKLIAQKSVTPDVRKTKFRITRKTMGNTQILDASFDLQKVKDQREKELAFEKFEEQPKLISQKSFTPEFQKIKSRVTRKTVGNNQILKTSFDLQEIKEQREKEIAFKNFEEQPNLIIQKSFTPNVQKKISRITRKTMGNNQILDPSFDLEAAKEQREKEIAFENFEEQPNLIIQKSFTPDVQKPKSRITRKTIGNNQTMDLSFDLETAKEEREKEIAFEKFEEQPNLIIQKSFTPDVQKPKSRITRKTIGNNQTMDLSFDLETAKEEREKEIAFEKFEEQPNLIIQKSFTPNVQKKISRITRKTMGNNQILDPSFDLEAAKEEREKEIAFENFEEQPNLIIQKSFTPDVQKPKSRITRKTIGNNQTMDLSFDLEAAKEEREKEIAFENFEEQPKLIIQKSFTPNVQKTKSRITRKTIGNNQILDASFDLEAVKEQREKEIAFENFEEQPNLIIQKSFTPDVQKPKPRITRKTIGNNQTMDLSFDLESAKEEREKEIAFENFEEQPKLILQKSFTPELQKRKSKITRKTIGNNQTMDLSFDLEAVKKQREKEIAFKNFQEQPNLIQKSFTPNVQKKISRITRKTMGNNQILDPSFDLEAAKEEREKEIAFENFEEQPNLIIQKSFTPDVQKPKSRITRKTIGNNQTMDLSFDLETAKEEREKEIAFEKFEEQPNLIIQKSFTPNVQKKISRITRKTMGNNQILDPSFDLQAAKEEREKEIAFENFEEQPNLFIQKSFTPDVQKPKSRITRKTIGNNQTMDLSFDLETAKEEREKEIAFENFEEQPNLIIQKSFTPNVQKKISRITRKTMGNNQILDPSFDLEAAKEEREKEIAFENFEEQPNLIIQKSFTPDVQKPKSRIIRKTIGNNQTMDSSFDLKAAKEEREKEIAFENFEEQPNLIIQKSFTPDVQKTKSRIIRKTIGNNQTMDSSFDLEAAKEEREKEIAFGNFKEQPKLIIQKSFTPNVQKTKSRITRKTTGNNQILDASFDVKAVKEQREKEIAFENFEEQPKLIIQKSFTPNVQKKISRITRKTTGNNQILDASFDVKAVKEQREKEIAFENFEDQPKLIAAKSFTPEGQKIKSRIPRKTIGNNQILDPSFDLQAAKEQREKEVAFKKFEEQPKLISQKSFTPEFPKTKSRITRKTIGNDQILDASFDLQILKKQREKEILFENFKEEANLVAQKSFTPEVQKTKSRINRKTLGNNQILDEFFDLEAVKKQYEEDFAGENLQQAKQMHSSSILEENLLSNIETTEIMSISSEAEDNNILEINNKPIEIKKMVSENIEKKIHVKDNQLFKADLMERNIQNPRKNHTRATKTRQNKKQVNVSIQIDSECEFLSGGELITVEYEGLEKNEDSLSNKEMSKESESENSFTKNRNGDYIFEEQNIVLESSNTNRVAVDIEIPIRSARRMRTEKKEVVQFDIKKEFSNNSVAEVQINEDGTKKPEILLRRVRFLRNNLENDVEMKDSVQSNILESDTSNQTHLLEIDTNTIETRRRGRRGQKKKIDDSKSNENLIVKEIVKNILTDTDTSTIVTSKLKDLENNITTDSDTNKTSPKTKVNRRRKVKESLKEIKKEIQLGSNPIKTSSKIRGRQKQKPTVSVSDNQNSLEQTDHLNSKSVSQISNNDLSQVEKNTESDSEVKIISPKIRVRRLRNVKLKQLELNAESDITTDVPNSSIEHSENFELNKTPSSIIADSGSELDINKTTSKLEGHGTRKTKLGEFRSNKNILKEAKQNIDPISDLNKISPKIKGRRLRIRKENNSVTSVKSANLTNESKPMTNHVESHSSESFEQSEPILSSSSRLNKITKIKERHARNVKESGSEFNVKNIDLIDGSSPTTIQDSSESLGESEPIESNLNINKLPMEIKKRSRRAAKYNKIETIENNFNFTEKTENNISSSIETEKSKIDVDSNSDSHRTPPKTRSKRGQQKNVDEIKESIETPTSMQEPIFKTPSSVAPKSRAARRLRSNSTSTPVMLDDNSNENDIKKGMPGRRLRSNSTTTSMIDESSPFDSEIKKKESDSEVNNTSPKIRRQRRRKIDLDDSKIEKELPTIQKEPEIKATTRASRRLRSNSISTPVVLDENFTLAEKTQVEDEAHKKEPKSTVSVDENLVLSEIENKDNVNKIIKMTGRSRRNPRNILQSKITENEIKNISKDELQDEIKEKNGENNKLSKIIKEDFSKTNEVLEMDIENEIKLTPIKAARTRTNKRKLHDPEEYSNDSEPGPVTERRTTRRRK